METRPFGPKIWEQLPPEVQAYILVLEEALRQSLERIAQLEQRVNELEARLNRNSSNSSQPPSQDPPQTPKKTKSEKSGRVPGGQPGHQGNHREHLPADKVDQIVEYRAEACPHCQSFLHESMGKQLPPRERHQVWELPEIRPHITEHRLLSGWCP